MVKRILGILITMALLLSVFGIISFAEGTSDFTVQDGILTAYTGSGGDVVIPGDLGITAIGQSAFISCETITSVVIPDGVTSIGHSAFAYCRALLAASLPSSITMIDAHAFHSCGNLTSITIPSSVTDINEWGDGAFYDCVSLVIYGEAGSYGQLYAQNHSIRFDNIAMAPPTPFLTAYATASGIMVNGNYMDFEGYNIAGYNYFKLRDLASSLNGTEKQFEVGYDSVNDAIALTTASAYTSVGGELAGSDNFSKLATRTESKLYLNGNAINITAYNIAGYNYFKLRDIAAVINFGVTWDADANMIDIDSTTGYTAE